jgi:hypothetical protein
MRYWGLAVVGLIVLLAVMLLGCAPRGEEVSRSTPSAGAPPDTMTPAAAVTVTPINCPQATPEFLWVEPVTSPTDQLAQTVTVHMGNLEVVTITTESGVFTATGQPAHVEVALLPNRNHHLQVVARVAEIWSGGCRFGGYTLHTRRDRNGNLLIIEQGQVGPPPVPSEAIEPENVSLLAPLFSLAPDARLTSDFDFSSTSELISVGYATEISRWNLLTGQESDPIGGGREEAAALCVAVNPDRSLIATGGTAEDPSVRLWDAVTGEMFQLGSHESYLTSVAFSPGGSRLASGDNADKVWIWDVASRQPITSFQGDIPKRGQLFSALYWLDEGRLIGAGSDAIYWWDVTTGQLLERLARPEQAAFFVDFSFSQGGNRLAGVAQDQNVYFWDREVGEWAIWPAQPEATLSHVEFSSDGRLLVATTYSGALFVWDVDNQESLASYSVTEGDIAAVRFSPDGRYLAVGGWDSVIWFWGIP